MSLAITIREDAPDDAAGVREVNELAFAGPDEARIVEALRGAEDTVSLVAELDNQVVGHILFTRVEIQHHPAINAAGLGPMAVRPEHQRQGIGSKLIRAGLEACRRAGYEVVAVVGHPEYYPRFGFVPAHRKGLEYESPVPRDAFMVLELRPGALSGSPGVVRYKPEFSAV